MIFEKYKGKGIVIWAALLCLRLAMGPASAQTEPLRHGLMVYRFQKDLIVWFGLGYK